MNARLLLVFLAATFQLIFTERNALCITPNGENATCVPFKACPVIYDSARKGEISAIEFALRSHCGIDSEPLVCCGTSRHYIYQTVTLLNNTESKEERVTLMEYYTTLLPNKSTCGLVKNTKRIWGGTHTQLDEFPWTAALEYKSKLNGENVGIKCGGSVINKRFVLTAAHCTLHIEFELIGVRLGDWNVTEDPDCLKLGSVNECADPVEHFGINQIFRHPLFKFREGTNDIALLLLDRVITYTGKFEYIRPICLPAINLPELKHDTMLTITGWGTTENNTAVPSDVKLKVEVPFVSYGACEHEAPKNVNPNTFCAGGEKGKDACRGDSGGPVMRIYEDSVTDRSNWYLEGIVSEGFYCGELGYPGVYTRVSSYMNWIINITTDTYFKSNTNYRKTHL